MIDPYELRVLAGPQAGANLGLKPGFSVDVGSLAARACQVVLRDPQVSEQRVRLHVREADVRLEVLSGSIDMAGQRLTAPCILVWPCFMPVRIGDTVLAIGDVDDEARWAHALRLALLPRAESAQQPDADPSSASTPAPVPEPPAALPERELAAGLALVGAVLTIAALGLLAFVSLATPAQSESEPPAQRMAHLLQAPEFRALGSETDPDHRWHVKGDLLTMADRAHLDRALTEAGLEASINVRVGEQVASAVQEVLRMNGVTAEAYPPTTLADVGVVRVKTSELNVPHLQQAEAAVRRDVLGLRTLHVENTPPAVVPEPTPVIDDPGKRVASIVPGPTPYVMTADGTRYFVGALLPSGHRLASISDQQVMLDKDGKLSPLKF